MKIHHFLFLVVAMFITFSVGIEMISSAIVKNDFLAATLLGTDSKSNTLSTPTLTTTKSNPTTPTVKIDDTLTVGTTDESVVILQKVLNAEGYTVSQSGPGSPGNETTYFGPATAASLSTYQKQNNLPVTGTLDKPTLERINTALKTIPVPASTPVPVTTTPTETRILFPYKQNMDQKTWNPWGSLNR